jgi:hypothetical protein
MKRVRLLVLLGAVAVALPLGLSAAHATGGGGGYPPPPANSVSIVSPAQYNLNGTYITVQVYARCKPAGMVQTGVVNLTVTQDYPETPVPTGAYGTFFANVVCDNNTHSAGVTVPVGPFDAGKAFAEAELVTPSGSSVKTSRWITIVANG